MSSPSASTIVACLAGPTASGKTAAALALAAELARRGRTLEIVSVDSALVYRGMDIGTAKPGAAELAAARHHLIDIRDPLHPYSAAEFVADARALLRDITRRGHVPLLVGGTMLYFKALFDGIAEMPPADAAVRAAIDARARAQGWPALHAELAQVDPATAARLAPRDSQRIQRALEVWQMTGRPLSSFHARGGASSPGQTGSVQGSARHRDEWDFRLFSLEPADRAWLHARIAQRFGQMLDEGLVGEVQRLRARGDLHADLPSMRCVGYRQAWDMLDGVFAPAELAARGIAATRQLAKRQITWLRAMPWRQAIACDAPDALRQTVQALLPVLLGEAVPPESTRSAPAPAACGAAG